MTDLRSALDATTNGGSQPFDILGMDACWMASIELDMQIIPYANIRIGSQSRVPGTGWPYEDILTALVGDAETTPNPDMPSEDLARMIVDKYHEFYSADSEFHSDSDTQSAVMLNSNYDGLIVALNDFLDVLMPIADLNYSII